MKRNGKIILVTAIAAGLTAVAIGATAAPGFGKGDCSAAQGPGGGYPMRGERFGGRHDQGDPAARLGELREKLAITEAQAPAWDAFVAKVTERHATREQRRVEMRANREANRDATPAERIDRRVEMMSARLAEMTEMSGTVKALYAELTPEQQAIFAEHGPGGRFGGPEGGPRHGGMHGHEGGYGPQGGEGYGHHRMERRAF